MTNNMSKPLSTREIARIQQNHIIAQSAKSPPTAKTSSGKPKRKVIKVDSKIIKWSPLPGLAKKVKKWHSSVTGSYMEDWVRSQGGTLDRLLPPLDAETRFYIFS